MNLHVLLLFAVGVSAINVKHLDPTILQTVSNPRTQSEAALAIIQKYSDLVYVDVDPLMFYSNKDVFYLRTSNGKLHIRSSSGVAAVWGFNYYLKKYCRSQIAWQVSRVVIPDPLPQVDEIVVANDRFRYYQNVCTASYSFVWWDVTKWLEHVEWMALNGINLALVPIAQESIWMHIYYDLGMTEYEIKQHFTGPAFLSWLRMGNVHGWGGPLLASWNTKQKQIQTAVVDTMVKLGMIPVLPGFNGHVPKAFLRLYPKTKFHSVQKWNKFGDDYCCGLFLDPNDALFKRLGKLFIRHMNKNVNLTHIYNVDPFNEVKIQDWSTKLVQDTAKAIFSTLFEADNKAVWMVQNWMFVSTPVLWPVGRVEAFLTSVPIGRMLILDLQSEQWPLYNIYQMYYGQPFIWCMLHNFGGTLGMFGNMQSINTEVYSARSSKNSTMVGIGLTPEGINQNYVVYDLMLESAYRSGPVLNMDGWINEYAFRRYGCKSVGNAWKSLLQSVYSFNGLNMMRGKYVITRRPSFRIKPWAWYKSIDLFDAFRSFAFVDDGNCTAPGFFYDLVDVTRQALQYRAEQIYIKMLNRRFSTSWVFNASMTEFIDVMTDMSEILATSKHFMAESWLESALKFATNKEEMYTYQLNARNQITLWGPNGEISDYACKQWAELFTYYYIPRWSTFLNAALDAKLKNETFDERATQSVIRTSVEEKFLYVDIITPVPSKGIKDLALKLYQKWAVVPDLDDLPLSTMKRSNIATPLPDVDYLGTAETLGIPEVVMIYSTSRKP